MAKISLAKAIVLQDPLMRVLWQSYRWSPRYEIRIEVIRCGRIARQFQVDGVKLYRQQVIAEILRMASRIA